MGGISCKPASNLVEWTGNPELCVYTVSVYINMLRLHLGDWNCEITQENQNLYYLGMNDHSDKMNP